VELGGMSILDIFATGFSCANDHRFLHYNRAVLTLESGRAGLLNSEIDSTASDPLVIKYWLTSEYARSHLNGQLAEMLQNIYWSYESRDRVRPAGNSFVYCPVCRGPLEDFEQDDVWVQGKRCSNGHESFERGGKLNYTVNGESTHLVCEMSDEVLTSLRNGWLNDPIVEPQLHPQIRRILERYGS
jgi:hypothetical protein